LKMSLLNLLSHLLTIGTLGTSRMNISEVAPNKGIFVPKSRSAPEISHDFEVVPNKGNLVPKSGSTSKISCIEKTKAT